MVYDNIGHGADHCFPPPGYKRPKSMKRTDGVGPVGRRTNGRRTVCGKDVRASCCCLCPVQSAPAAAASVRACVRAAASAVCGQAVRAAAAPVRACSCVGRVQSTPCCCSVCSCVQLRRPCVLLQRLFVRAAASSVRAAASAVCSQPGRCGPFGRSVRRTASRFVNVGRSYISAPRRGRSLFEEPRAVYALSFVPPSTKRQAPSAKC
ncbi:hypothetical protein AAC387_Pa12g0249 [Persea americana]